MKWLELAGYSNNIADIFQAHLSFNEKKEKFCTHEGFFGGKFKIPHQNYNKIKQENDIVADNFHESWKKVRV